MRQKTHETVPFSRRTISLLLALMVILTSITFCMTTTASAASVAYYFDTSQNTAWNPGSGEMLVATFTNSSGNEVGSYRQLVSEGTNLYSVVAPDGAADIQLYLVRSDYPMPSYAPASGKTRVFLKNNVNWNPPKVYCWGDGEETTFDNSPAMNKLRSDSNYWWFYDTDKKNVIFHNGVGGDTTQTADLAISGKNPVYSKYSKSTGSSGWDSAPYYKKYAEVSLSGRPAGANEMYALSGDTVKFSKYSYVSPTQRGVDKTKKVYLYNPDWTEVSKVKVTWDFDDPYSVTYNMTNATDGYGDFIGDGFYEVEVPADAVIQFSYDYATSKQTAVPEASEIDCFIMKNGSGHWGRLADAKGEATDYIAPVESSGHNSGDAFWVDAVYYDYLSDAELTNGWLNPKKAGTFNFGGAQDSWYENYHFNDFISSYASDNGVTYPLYFGNYCNTPKAYDDNANNLAAHNGPYSNAMKDLYNFYYYVNNSNGLMNRHYAVRGLAADSLDSDGNIRFSSGAAMPYFDSDWLQSNTYSGRSIGKSVKSAFPFRIDKSMESQGVTKYTFDSQGAKDNVFFNWSSGSPVSVGYGMNSGYGIKDGLDNFMYDEPSGYGIFPFNNTASTKSGRGGNDNLDYGFGIKMEMDFRVPEGGVLPNGQDCTFSFSGDDDLWVYISEYNDDGTLGDSRLSLDLGGNHKKAEGVINFKTMQYSTSKIDNSEVTKAAVATTNPNFKSDTMYIIDSDNWGDVWIYAWEGGSNKWFHCGHEYINGSWYYTAKLSQFDGYTNFKCTGGQNNWTHQSANNCKIKSQLGNICYANNPNYCEENASDFSRTTTQSGLTYEDNNVKHAFGFDSNGSGGYRNLDPAKTYHMSVFYMERGMIESNCKIEFTMTPAQNDVKVQKIINTEDVNPGLESALISTSSFDMKTKENDIVNTTAYYTKNENNYKTRVNSADGTYKMSHLDIVDFDNQYGTGSTLSVSESKPSGGIKYGQTDWEVINVANGERIANGSDTAHPYSDTDTNDFVLLNTNKNSYTTRQVNFVNTPSVSTLTLSKDIVDKDGNALSTPVQDEFSFELLVNLHPELGGDYLPYKLTYEVVSDGDVTELTTGADGRFKFSSNDTVTITGLPVGATYQLRELTASGYKPFKISVDNGVAEDFNGTYSGAVSQSPNTLDITNKQQPVTTNIQVRKYLTQGRGGDALYENGELFTFKAEGLGKVVYNGSGDETIDASAMRKEVSLTDSNGVATFGNEGGTDSFLSFTSKGAYAFKITESAFNPIEGDNFYDTDISMDTNQYLALFIVDDDPANPGALIVNDPTYYYYYGGAIDASSFNTPIDTDIPEFKNTVTEGQVDINKYDNKKDVDGTNAVEDVVFEIYKVDNTESGSGEDITLINPQLVESQTTDESGKAIFWNLDIFKKNDEGKIDAEPQYQMYALMETSTDDDHYQSKIIHVFSLPMVGDDGNAKYNITFDYVNGVIKAPETAGRGVMIFRIIGTAAIVISVLMLLMYVFYFRKKGYQFFVKRK